MLPGITYCSVDLLLVFCFVLPSGLCVWQRDVVGEVEVGKKVVCVGLWVMKYHIPPLFLAPNLFPAPSFAELAAPWALCEAWRTPMEVVELARAGVDRRKALRAVSMVAMAGEEPVGSARILGSNMVRAVCVIALSRDRIRWSLCCCALDFRLSAASAIVLGTRLHVGNDLDTNHPCTCFLPSQSTSYYRTQ
jgi:hypothetical protein